MSKGLLILVSAPSGAGKTSLVAAALKNDEQLVVSVSHTTRPQRPGEEDGVNYHFIEKDTFEQMIKDAAFLEHALVFGNHYGTSVAGVQALREQGKDVVLEIDWQGGKQIMARFPEAISIFVLPPSEAALQERLVNRGQDSQEVIERRLSEARLEMSQAPNYRYIVVNDDFELALADINAIVRTARLESERQVNDNANVRTILSGS